MTTGAGQSSTRLALLRELAAFRASHGLALSLFFGFDPLVVPTGAEVAARMASLLDAARRQQRSLADDVDRAARAAFDVDIERARLRALEVPAAPGAGGIACFSAEADGLWQSLEVRGALPDAVFVGTELQLTPLVVAPPDEDALVAVAGHEAGRLYWLSAGRLDEIADLTSDQPRSHRGGPEYREPKQLRGPDVRSAAHLRQLAATIDTLVQAGPAALVLAGDAEHTAALEGLLSHAARTAVAGAVRPEAHAALPELARLVAPLVEGRRAEDESVLVERWREGAGRGDRAVAGWADTLAAVSDGRAGVLLFREGASAPVFACPACERASVESGPCPLDGQQLAPHPDGLGLALRRTLAQGGEARVVRDRRDLDPVGGIGALLTF